MTSDIKKIGRKFLALSVSIVMYYLIHEGAHLLFALATNSFERINFMFPGVQVQVNVSVLSNFQFGIFNLLGAVATLSTAYILCLFRDKIGLIKSNAVRAIFYYLTLLFLLNDPVYLSILCGFFGGGDMNGISLLIPELLARLIFGAIGMINLVVIIKIIVPVYKKAFELNNKS